MSYKDEIECPYCHKVIELDIEIEGDDGYMNLCPIVMVKGKEVESLELTRTFSKTDEKLVRGVTNGTVNMEGKH